MGTVARVAAPVAGVLLLAVLTACAGGGPVVDPASQPPSTAPAALTESSDPSPEPAPEPEPEPAPAAEAGSREAPAPVGTAAKYAEDSFWTFTLGETDTDAWPEIANENQFNEPPAEGSVYVLAPVHVTGG